MKLPIWRKALASLALLLAGAGGGTTGPILPSNPFVQRTPDTGSTQDMENAIRSTPAQDSPPSGSPMFPLGSEAWRRARQAQLMAPFGVPQQHIWNENRQPLERPVAERRRSQQQTTGTEKTTGTPEEPTSESFQKESNKPSDEKISKSPFMLAVEVIARDTQVSVSEKYHTLDTLVRSLISNMRFDDLFKLRKPLLTKTVVSIALLLIVALQNAAAGSSLFALTTNWILKDALAQQGAGLTDRISTPVLNGLVCLAAVAFLIVILALVYAGFLAEKKNAKAQSVLDHLATAVISLIGGVVAGKASAIP